MTRDPIWLILLAIALSGVAACALLGGPTKSPLVVDCHDGTTCPEGYACPFPGGKCEYTGGIVEQWGSRAVDAGR